MWPILHARTLRRSRRLDRRLDERQVRAVEAVLLPEPAATNANDAVAMEPSTSSSGRRSHISRNASLGPSVSLSTSASAFTEEVDTTDDDASTPGPKKPASALEHFKRAIISRGLCGVGGHPHQDKNFYNRCRATAQRDVALLEQSHAHNLSDHGLC